MTFHCDPKPPSPRLRRVSPKRSGGGRVALLWMLFGAVVSAQSGTAARPARDRAPIDLTGYWVSYVTENWRYRMVTPAKGEYRRIPVSPAALPLINNWDPAADERAGNQCKSYGAGAIMSVPGRLHITWQDANTLRIETDAGKQTRLLRFTDGTSPAARAPVGQVPVGRGAVGRALSGPPSSAPTWQGESI